MESMIAKTFSHKIFTIAIIFVAFFACLTLAPESAFAAPTLTASVSPSLIAAGQSSTITWSSANAVACYGSGSPVWTAGWTQIALSGSVSTGVLNSSSNYYIYCRDVYTNLVYSAWPMTVTVDSVAPVITRLGVSPVNLTIGSAYVDAGATASDNLNGNITANIVTVNPVNTAIPATYTVTYNVSDTAGNPATQVTRTVNVVDTRIVATSGANGTVTPVGTTTVAYNGSQTYTITPSVGYHIATLIIDGGAVATSTTYTFSNVTASHTISATFAVDTFTITATAGANGTITPLGAVIVASSTNQTFTITPAGGYDIATMSIDGVLTATTTSYTFSNVLANHTIAVTFALLGAPPSTYTITATSGPNGSIAPSGTIIVATGATPSYVITPNAGFDVATVIVDGASVATSSPYTFAAVAANHTIAVSFILQGTPTFTITASTGANGTITPLGA
ncbi:MAG: immunoglobulin-like domain-containing protein, partial [Minisyncoccia bacterium]